MLLLRRMRILLMLGLGVSGCWAPDPVGPAPNPPPNTDLCVVMCARIGPQGLGCEEGGPVYNNDLPGPSGVPNQSCVANCEELQTKGFFVNPKCVATVPSCGKIEEYRLKSPDECQI